MKKSPIISPIKKRESINCPDSYRKVTVMPVLGKLLKSVIKYKHPAEI